MMAYYVNNLRKKTTEIHTSIAKYVLILNNWHTFYAVCCFLPTLSLIIDIE